MSHFSVMVIGEDAEAQLAPYHEFECTGINDQYVIEVDETEEYREQYETETSTRLRSPDGQLHEPWDDQFYRDPTPEEAARIGPLGGSGCAGGIAFSSRDWKDGRGHRAKVKFVPEGYEEIKIPRRELSSFIEFVEDYTGRPVVKTGEPIDVNGAHKWGHILVGDDGSVRVIDRTNPNKKWDYYTLGGRYSGLLLLKSGGRADAARKRDIEFTWMQTTGERAARERFSLYELATRGLEPHKSWPTIRDETEGIDNAHKAYHAQPAIKALRELEATKWFDADDFLVGREAYVRDAGRRAMATFAFVRDGKWHEEGNMGWWACVSNENPDWLEEFESMLAEVGDDELIQIFDCHI